jgi:cullin 3
MKDAIQMIYA